MKKSINIKRHLFCYGPHGGSGVKTLDWLNWNWLRWLPWFLSCKTFMLACGWNGDNGSCLWRFHKAPLISITFKLHWNVIRGSTGLWARSCRWLPHLDQLPASVQMPSSLFPLLSCSQETGSQWIEQEQTIQFTGGSRPKEPIAFFCVIITIALLGAYGESRGRNKKNRKL